MGRKHNRVLACVAVAGSLCLAASCTSGGTATSGPAAAGDQSGGASSGALKAGQPIVISAIGSVQIAGEAGLDKGFMARAARTNAAGGIDGHKIVFKSLYDDGGSTQTDLSDVQTMILRDHVFAISPVASVSFDPGLMNFLAAHHTPMVGYAFTPVSCGQSYFFPVIGGGCYVAGPAPGRNYSVSPLEAYAKATGKKPADIKVAIILTQSSANDLGVAAEKQAATQLGFNVVYAKDSLPQTPVTNYTPYIQPLLAAHPDLIYLGIPYAQELGMMQAAKDAGFKGDIGANSGVPSDVFTATPSAAATLNGSYQTAPWPYASDGTPAVQQEITDLKKAGIYQEGQFFSFGQSVGYWTADALINMLEATAKAGPISQTNFKKVVDSGNYSYKGPQGYLSQKWPDSHDETTAACVSITKVDTAAKDFTKLVPFGCYPLAKLH